MEFSSGFLNEKALEIVEFQGLCWWMIRGSKAEMASEAQQLQRVENLPFKKYSKSTQIWSQGLKAHIPEILPKCTGADPVHLTRGRPCTSMMYELRISAKRTRSETYYRKGGRAASSTSVLQHRAFVQDPMTINIFPCICRHDLQITACHVFSYAGTYTL